MYLRKLLSLLIIMASGFYIFLPRPIDIWSFNPADIGNAEARMWQYYYEERFLLLGRELFILFNYDFAISPWDAVCFSYATAHAAYTFRRSRNRTEAEKAVPYLEMALRRMASRTGHTFDARQAATLELEWWQQRRERVSPDEYAHTMSRILELIYQSEDPRFLESSKIRASAMNYRDQRRKGKMAPEDWKFVSEQLNHAYIEPVR